MILKHRDKKILRFDWLEPHGVVVREVYGENVKFLPLEMKGETSDEALWTFLCKRIVPKNRAYVHNFLANLGLKPDDIRGIIKFCRGLSLNDVHWVSEDDDAVAWSEVNLYENEFSDTLAYMAFAGVSDRVSPGSSSPELTTNGMLAKCWRRRDGVVALYKSGTEGAANCGNEPYSEFYAAQLAEALGLEHVPYSLAKFKGRLCSVCPLFTSDKYGYIPAGRLISQSEAIHDPRFAKIFFFDALICNPDRHLGNFGYLIDNDTNEIVGAAPIFDNGYGLFARALDRKGSEYDDLEHLDCYVKKISPALYPDWLGFPGGITAEMKTQLKKLSGFRFKRHSNYNLSTRRLRIIEDFLQKLIAIILDCDANEMVDDKISPPRDTIKNKNSLGDDTIISNLMADPFVTAEELGEVLSIGVATVKRRLAKLQSAGRIKRTGSRKTGAWEVLLK